MVTPGQIRLIASIVLTNCPAPPSGRSSRVTEVITACLSFRILTASATRSGSQLSTGPGAPLCTAQKRHFRVLLSPKIMKVAVPRPKHSPMFGQSALSQTVPSFNPSEQNPHSLERFRFRGRKNQPRRPLCRPMAHFLPGEVTRKPCRKFL